MEKIAFLSPTTFIVADLSLSPSDVHPSCIDHPALVKGSSYKAPPPILSLCHTAGQSFHCVRLRSLARPPKPQVRARCFEARRSRDVAQSFVLCMLSLKQILFHSNFKSQRVHYGLLLWRGLMNRDNLPRRNGWQLLLELCIKDGSLVYISVSRKFARPPPRFTPLLICPLSRLPGMSHSWRTF